MQERAGQPWLYGPLRDLFFGCGIVYLLLLALRAGLETRLPSLLPVFLVQTFFLIPHYGATLLRAYETRSERRKYWVFTVYTTIALIGIFVLALQNVFVGSLMLTVFLTWSPWHYSGQNYGLAVMFLRRRGVDVRPGVKRLLYFSFVCSFAMVFLVIHGLRDGATYTPVPASDAESYRVMALGIPYTLSLWATLALGAAQVVCTVAVGVLLLRRTTFAVILPAVALVFTQAMWFTIPILVRVTPLFETKIGSVIGGTSTPYGFTLVAAGHAIQYLWITAFYARASHSTDRFAPFYVKTLLSGAAIWLLPTLLFAPSALNGGYGGLTLLTAALVNLHHFVLDGAIWKLRDGRIARFLVRSPRAAGTAPEAIEPTGGGWVRRLVWGVCIALFVLRIGMQLEYRSYRTALAEDDLPRMRTAAKRLAWVGREGGTIHYELGVRYAEREMYGPAVLAFQQSIEAAPTVKAWMALGRTLVSAGEDRRAANAFQGALKLQPDNAGAAYRAGQVWLRLGRTNRAVVLLERANELRPGDSRIQRELERARQANQPAGGPAP